MDSLRLFKFENHDIEVIVVNDEPLFNPCHVGNCFGLSYSVVRNHVAEMNDNQTVFLKNSDVLDTDIRKLHNTGENFLTESGVYHLISTSKKASIKKFKAKLIEFVLPQKNNTEQYVYIIEFIDTGTVKMGVAQNIKKRLKQLQTGSPSKLELVYKSIVCSNAYEIEKIVHNKFKNVHIRGGWYKVNKQNIIAFLEQQTFVLKSGFFKYISVI